MPLKKAPKTPQILLREVREIRAEQVVARGERQEQSTMVTEIHTVLIGPRGLEHTGLVAQVQKNTKDISVLQKLIIGTMGVGSIGGGVWLSPLKSLVLSIFGVPH